MINTSKEIEKMIFDRIPCIHYLVQKDKKVIWALINLSSKVNAITPAYAFKPGLRIREIDIKT